MQLTENFTLEEMVATKQPYQNNPSIEVTVNLCRLAFYLLQPLRNLIQCSVDIICAFRSEKVNEAVGGTDKSQHLTGQAVDINCKKISKLDLFKLIASNLKFDQLIYEVDANCLHVSYVSEELNRNEILLRRLENGKKHYYTMTKESIKNLKSIV